MNSYEVTFRFYDRYPEKVYLQAQNNADAFDKAHSYITPNSNCCGIEPRRISKKYMAEHNLRYSPKFTFYPKLSQL